VLRVDVNVFAGVKVNNLNTAIVELELGIGALYRSLLAIE